MPTLTEKIHSRRLMKGLIICTGMVLSSLAVAAEPDWSGIDSVTVKAFYPGVASWDFLNSEDHNKGSKAIKNGSKACVDCHISKKGDVDMLADEIVTGELTKSESGALFEPTPKAGLDGFKDMTVQAAYDAQNIYLRVSWPSNGKSFKDASLADKKLADKVSIQIANKIKTFSNYGCYMTCHDDQIDMPAYRGNKQTLYTYFSYSKGKLKPQEKLDGYLAKGQFVDLWVAEFKGQAVVASDQHILQQRLDDKGDLEASGSYSDGRYSLVFKRKLDTADSGDIAMSVGSAVDIAISIHDEGTDSRYHYTSFPLTLGLDAQATLKATKL